jgi:hypothetical protein
MPVPDPTVAIAVLPLHQLPPLVASASVAVVPAQVTAVPVIADGKGFTVMVDVAVQPVGSV